MSRLYTFKHYCNDPLSTRDYEINRMRELRKFMFSDKYIVDMISGNIFEQIDDTDTFKLKETLTSVDRRLLDSDGLVPFLKVH